MDPLLRDLLAAKTARSVVSFLEAVADHHPVKWRPVGGRENNLATINLGTDPAAGLIERVTNAIDAVLEREWQERRAPAHIRSPRQAVEEWFDIPEGKLANVPDVRDESFQELSWRVLVRLNESEKDRHPTVDIRDTGVGLLTEEFKDTILSLNETLKLKKFFLAGAFGQGGSTALSYSIFTLIMSRRVSAEPADTPHPVAATVVRFNPGDLETDKHGLYEYLVDSRTGHPLTFDASIDEFTPGTLVRHVCMDVGKYAGILTAPTNSLWYLAHHYLFDSVLPIRLVEERSNKSMGENRFSGGNFRRLDTGSHTQYKRSARRTFRAGTVVVSWWVLTFEGDKPQDRITNYCLASRPMIITYNGQKQGELSNALIKNDLKFPYLDRFLIVHVDCDHLDNESRRQLFPTTRENLRDISLLEDLRRLVIDTLEADEELGRLDRERRQRYMQRVESQSVESLRRRLASRIQSVTKAAEGGGPRTRESGSGEPTKPKPPIPIQEPPTFLEITTPSPKNVFAGRTSTLHFRTDADPSYFFSPDAFIAIITPPGVAQYTGTTTVKDGYGTTYFKVSESSTVGTSAEITLELRPQRARALDSSVDIEVKDLPEGVGTDRGKAATPNINPIWITREDQFWSENGWDEDSVARVVRTDESADIYVSSENRRLSSLIVRAQRKGLDVVEAVKDFYLEHVCFHALLEDLQRTAGADSGRETIKSSAEDQLEKGESGTDAELGRAAETVCGIIDSMFEFIATGSVGDSDD